MMKRLYFPHDFYARNDPKLIKLFRVLGFEGKALYWDILEVMYEQGGVIYDDEIDDLAFTLHTEKKVLASIFSDFNLFLHKKNYFYSKSLEKRLNALLNKSEQAKIKAKKRWAISKGKTYTSDGCNSNATVMQQQCNSNATVMQQQCNSNANKSKVNKSKVNKSKVNKSKIKEKEKTFVVSDEATSVSENLFLKIQKDWNNFAREKNLAECKIISEKRKQKITARMKNENFNFDEILKCISESDFLLGKKTEWKITFDWIFENDSNFIKILEGNYKNGKSKNYNGLDEIKYSSLIETNKAIGYNGNSESISGIGSGSSGEYSEGNIANLD